MELDLDDGYSYKKHGCLRQQLCSSPTWILRKPCMDISPAARQAINGSHHPGCYSYCSGLRTMNLRQGHFSS